MGSLSLDLYVRRFGLGCASRYLPCAGLRLAFRLFVLLIAIFGVRGVARAQDYCSSGSEGVISNYVPQAGIAGVTQIYISGSCLGNISNATVSIGGIQVPTEDILLWTDDQIELILPATAQTGVLDVQSYGGDATCPSYEYDSGYWCSTSEISGSITVFSPAYPSFYGTPPKIDPAGPSSPQYVEGVWNYNDGFGLGQFVLSQGPQNSDGTYTISGSIDYVDELGNQCSGPITGSLNAVGVLLIQVPDGDTNDVPPGQHCGYHDPGMGWSEEWVVLNSGDATSPGWLWTPDNPYDPCNSPPANYPADLTMSYECFDIPLFKSQTDLPTTESPEFLGWLATNGSQDPTYGAWQRVLPQSTDGLVQFSGRFVFEQRAPGGSAIDGCYNASNGTSPYPPYTGVTGGGWYTNASGVWGSGNLDGTTNLSNSDDIGINSDRVQWYQQNVSQCSIIVYQTMFIDGVNAPIAYNTGGPNGSTNQLQIVIDNTLGPPLYCTGVIPSGSSLVPACEQYPPQ
jgi:hypothetical protein